MLRLCIAYWSLISDQVQFALETLYTLEMNTGLGGLRVGPGLGWKK